MASVGFFWAQCLGAGKDQQLIHIPRLDQLAALAHGICRALKPAWTFGGLLGRQHRNKAAAQARSCRRVPAAAPRMMARTRFRRGSLA